MRSNRRDLIRPLGEVLLCFPAGSPAAPRGRPEASRMVGVLCHTEDRSMEWEGEWIDLGGEG
jgi:hypothetical protein